MSLMDAAAVVPFRLASARFPDKALCKFEGRTLIEHAVSHARRLTDRRVILTAPSRDIERARSAIDDALDVQWVESSEGCQCATQRVVEVYPRIDAACVVTVPVDEPLLEPEEVLLALDRAAEPEGVCATTFYCDFHAPEDFNTPLSAKVVTDARGWLLYMSRAIIPVRKDGATDASALKKNVGVFVFPRPFLDQLAARAGVATTLDVLEGLEQLRWLELGLSVRCLKIHHIGFGVDVPEQLSLLSERLRCALPHTRSE